MPDAVSLPQLLELSIGSPELGAVNFSQLHKLLYEIISRLGLSGHQVPLSDIDEWKDSKSTLSKSPYSSLADKVQKIEKEVGQLGSTLPSAREVIDKIKSDSPLTDLWQYMSLNKRVEANEDGIKTAMNLVQQLIKDMQKLKDENKELKDRFDKMDDISQKLRVLDGLKEDVKKLNRVCERLDELDNHRTRLDALQARLDSLPLAEDIVTWPGLEDGLNGVRGEFAAYKPEAYRAETDTRGTSMTPVPTSSTNSPAASSKRPASGRMSRASSRAKSTTSEGPSGDVIDLLERLGTIDRRHEELRKKVEELEKAMANKANKDEVSNKLPDDLMDRIQAMDEKLADLKVLQAKDSESIKYAQRTIEDLKEDLDNIQKITDYLNKENDARVKSIQLLNEETSRLDAVKVNKEYVDTELDMKADKSQVEGKVNRSIFDSAILDLQKMIDDLLSKLNAYEEAWKRVHGKLEEDVDGKIDRNELERLKSYLDRKIKDLSAKLKQSQGLFNPFCDDAAGMKRQLLPFNCLSCDKPVTVGQSSSNILGSVGDSFSGNKSSRPYTTFELDQIRQQAKNLLHADYVMDYYSIPRSAGGAHTMTYASKRVSRTPYREEVRPAEDTPIDVFTSVNAEAEIVGADGHVYRGMRDPRETIEARLPTAIQDAKPGSPKRPGSSRPGNINRPKTAGASRHEQPERPTTPFERPSSARPSSSMAGNEESRQLEEINPPAVTIYNA